LVVARERLLDERFCFAELVFELLELERREERPE
jgi:hypothetical protein